MQHAVEDWLRWCGIAGRADETVRQYRSVMGMFVATLGDPPPAPAGMTVNQIERWIEIHGRQRCRNTVTHNLRVISSFWTWASRRYKVPNPMQELPRMKQVTPDRRFLTEDEYAAVLAACKRLLERDMIQLYGNTGLRREEMRAIRWRDIYPDSRTLRVPKGKGCKARVIPLNDLCLDVLTRNRSDDTFAFLQRWRCRSSHNALCRRLAGRAGIEGFGPHALRHYFATRMILAGVPMKLVSLILGHEKIATTEQIYTHVAPMSLMGATDVLIR